VARKPRNYAAEYAARKRRATELGYKSEREYKGARKRAEITRRELPPPKETLLRREAKRWSDEHSLRRNSRYSDTLTVEQVERYHRAFVERLPKRNARTDSREKMRRIRDYLVPDFLDEKEWDVNPSTVPLRR